MTPPKNAERTIGRKLKNTERPVSAALPVVTRTYQGIASCATAFPESEIASAVYTAYSGVRLATGKTVDGRHYNPPRS